MKRIGLFIFIVLSSAAANAQWTTTGSGSDIFNSNAGNVGIGGSPSRKLDVGLFTGGSLSNQVVLRVRNTVAQNQESGWGSAIEFYNMSNNILNQSFSEGGAKIISEASQYGWAHNLKFRVVSNNNYASQTAVDAMTINTNGNIAVGRKENGVPGELEVLSISNNVASNTPSGTSAVIQFYNSTNNYVGSKGASIKSISSNDQYGWESDMYLRTTKNNSFSTQAILDAVVIKGGSGNVGIGTSTPDAKLAVKGTVHANEVKVDLNVQGPDYVFEPNYTLPSLDFVQAYINQNKHLPEVPSAKEMGANGVNLGEMNMLLLKKVEELTLYMLEQQKTNVEQAKEIELLKILIATKK